MRKSIFTPDQEKLQTLLRQTRIEAGLRQAELARRIGSTQSFVSKYETGERRLDLLELRRVCTALDISLEEFVRRFEEKLKESGDSRGKVDEILRHHHKARFQK